MESALGAAIGGPFFLGRMSFSEKSGNAVTAAP